MSITTYQLIHVIAAFLLTAFTFMACASASAGKNKRILMITGVLSLLVLVGGFGLLAQLNMKLGENPWLFVKIAAWLMVSAASGLVYRKPQKAGAITAITMLAIVAAIVMVYTRPF